MNTTGLSCTWQLNWMQIRQVLEVVPICPSGLRGSTQVRIYSYARVRITSNAFLFSLLQQSWCSWSCCRGLIILVVTCQKDQDHRQRECQKEPSSKPLISSAWSDSATTHFRTTSTSSNSSGSNSSFLRLYSSRLVLVVVCNGSMAQHRSSNITKLQRIENNTVLNCVAKRILLFYTTSCIVRFDASRTNMNWLSSRPQRSPERKWC